LNSNPGYLWSTICPRLSSLTFENTEVPDLEAAPVDMMFPNIKHFRVKSITGAASMEWLKIAYMFPHLESVDLATRDHQPVVQELSQHAVENSWPWSRACRFRFDQSQLSSEDMSRFLGCIEADRVWRVPYARMTTQSFEDLSRHFDSLEELDLGVSSAAVSYMIQEILELCPRLMVLRGYRVSFLDIAHGGPWACRSLKSLKLFFDPSATSVSRPALSPTAVKTLYGLAASPSSPVPTTTTSSSTSSSSPTDTTVPIDLGQLVLQNLGALSDLEELDVGRPTIPNKTGIEFSREKGLERLVGLKKLKVLRFKHTKQYMEDGDIAWMLSSWPELKVVQGLLNYGRAFGINRSAKVLNTKMNRNVDFINDL
ncbi:hypothetical protein BGX27_003289, partial [Mortierella sp. AM989]